MGQQLDKPVVVKSSESGRNGFLVYGVSGMQGYRISMEDSHSSVGSVSFPNSKSGSDLESSFFGVYDGHSGAEAAKYLSQHLLENVLQSKGSDGSGNSNDIFSDNNLTKVFLKTDELLSELCVKEGFYPGSTCCTAFVNRHVSKGQLEVICVNVGDSRCVLCNQGATEPMSIDHKPSNSAEKKRIYDAGSFVEFGRVNGTLAVSRAFGDITYKDNQKLTQAEQAVTALPEIKRVTINLDEAKKSSEPTFLIIACDGLWDVMKNEEAVNWVKNKLQEIKASKSSAAGTGATNNNNKNNNNSSGSGNNGEESVSVMISPADMSQICQDLLDHAVLTLDSKDNVSVIIILIQP